MPNYLYPGRDVGIRQMLWQCTNPDVSSTLLKGLIFITLFM